MDKLHSVKTRTILFKIGAARIHINKKQKSVKVNVKIHTE